ncbi:MAG: right-handed parallel beta-helix repeat-containing protein [Thermoanaerobaculia bacterium]
MAADASDDTTRFVDPVSGSDEADGQSADRAWRSLQSAFDRLQPGQTLLLMGGDYRGEVQSWHSHFVLAASGTPESWIRVAAAPGSSPTIRADQGNGIEVTGSYVEISGLNIVGESFGVDNDYGWGILIRNSHHVRAMHNEVSGMPVGGIGTVEASNVEIIENRVHDNCFWGPEQGSGISMWHSVDAGTEPSADGYHNRIVGNVLYRNENKVFSQWREHDAITDGNGIIVDQFRETGYTGRTLVANNVAFDNGGRGILILESDRVDVLSNTTFHNGRTPGLEGGAVELAAGHADDVVFANNLAWGLPGAPALAADDTTGLVTGGNVLVTDRPDQVAGESDLVVAGDPGVRMASVDPQVADFRPTAGSLLLGRAVPVAPVLIEDAARTPRSPAGAAVGAFELATGAG